MQNLLTLNQTVMAKANRKRELSQKEKMSLMIKHMSDFEVVLMVERLIKMMDMTVQDIKENPETWSNSFVFPKVYIDLNQKISKYLTDEKI